LRVTWKLTRFRPIIRLFPWTPLGIAAAGLSLITLKWLAFEQLDLVLLVIGYVVIATLLGTAILVYSVAFWVKVFGAKRDLHSDPFVLETGVTSATNFVISRVGYLPLIYVRWTWQEPLRAEVKIHRSKGTLLESVTILERGQIRQIRRLIVIGDVFGLSQISFLMSDAVLLDVLPRFGKLDQIPELVSMASGDQIPFPTGAIEGDRFELQRYTPGDPARFIHWKVFGRTRKLMTRTPERSQAPLPKIAAFQIAGGADDATAAVARLAIEKGLLGYRWVFGTDTDPDGTSEISQALNAVMRSAAATESEPGSGMPGFFTRAERDGPTRAVVFAPPQSGTWLDRLVNLGNTRDVVVLIGVDELVEDKPISPWRRLVFKPEAAQVLAADRVREVLATLSRSRCQVIVLNRQNGRLYGEAIAGQPSMALVGATMLSGVMT
jgi:hypothetical protein